MDLGLAGKVALVTASSRGLGQASAAALAAEGAALTICGRNAESLHQTEAGLRASGAEVHALVADVTEPSAPRQLVEATLARFGRLDVLVANAGGPPPARSLDVTDEQLEAALNDNLLTSIRLVREALPPMRSAGWGRICLLTSFYIRQPSPTLALSNTARTGLWAWAKTAAQDVFRDGITINLACPGFHATERIKGLTLPPEVPVGRPEDFGRVVAFLCSEPARFINGAAIQVDGGVVGSLS